VTLRVLDVAGREVARLLDGDLGSGSYTVRWRPPTAGAGVYFLQAEAGANRETRKLLRLR
jgi:hypothetical protein